MLAGLRKNILGTAICIALIATTFVAVGLLRLPLIYTVLGLGMPAFAYAWALVRRAEKRTALLSEGAA
jgi:chromate transporter